MHAEFKQSPREFAIRLLAGNGRAAVVRFLVPIPLSLGLALGLSLTSSPENPGRAELRLRQLRLHNLVSHVTSNDISDPNRLSTVACAKCHGQLLNPEKSQDRWQNAYQVWVSQDPHSDAYVSLWNRQSQRIVAALAQAAGKIQLTTGNAVLSNALYQQTINERCVSCHSTVPAAMSVEMNVNQKSSAENLSMANGVGCLSCHSTTELDNPEGKDWIEAHTKKPWAEYSTNEKTRLGLQDLTQHDARAQTCIKCHLGSPGRDVDHDLVAAGHPRLAFEYASHLLRLPKHWEEEKTNHFYTTCWSIGQLESAKGALTLLKHRATSAAQGNVAWPEFTEYNCSSCHHGLGASWYLPNDPPGVGKPGWGTWTFPKDAAINATQGDLKALRTEMEQPQPDSVTVVQIASAIVPALRSESPVDNLYFYIQRQPRLNPDEVWAWYLAVNCCIQDSLLERAAGEVVVERMLELETMLKQPFGDSADKRPFAAKESLEKISQIRQIVLPVLETNRTRPNRQP